VVNSFHKVAKIYPLLEFFRNEGLSPSVPSPGARPPPSRLTAGRRREEGIKRRKVS
jgi:hypothetical protein